MAFPAERLVLVLAAAAALVFVPVRKNLALHKPVRASSTRLGEPSALVNGAVEWGNYGLHTRADHPAWVVVDLEDTYRIGEVRVFGRGDGFFVENAPRLPIKISADGRRFTQVASCEGLFTQVSPCRVDLHGAAARYVRIEDAYLVLSEIEVYEAP